MKRVISILLVVSILNIFVLTSSVSAAFSKTEATNIYKNTKIENITSKAYAIGNADANQVVQSSLTANDKIRVGNVNKLMTLYLVYQAIAEGKLTMESELEVSVAAQEISTNRARVFLDGYKHEIITVKQALEAVCIASANDAAYVLAEGVGGTEQNFVEMMKERSAE